ncbi:MAG: hypothetical protein U5R48_08455 [Gammaproteobacteria bacterium]|nr:hypothetical protein [Gammaproteobacteria bacterium]
MTDDHRQDPNAAQEPEHDDAAEAHPVRQYYEDKKKRYMQQMREATKDMNTGTPFDWEDAERYAEEGENRHSRAERQEPRKEESRKKRKGD